MKCSKFDDLKPGTLYYNVDYSDQIRLVLKVEVIKNEQVFLTHYSFLYQCIRSISFNKNSTMISRYVTIE